MQDNLIQQIQNQLFKKATVFETGGIRPQYTLEESWIGMVPFALPQEELPVDASGKAMYPLLQINLSVLPSVPEVLHDIKMLSVFISESFAPEIGNHLHHFAIREYTHTDDLVLKKLIHPKSSIQSFPLTFEPVENDSPSWDAPDIPAKIADQISELEEDDEIEYFDDIATLYYQTKVGGYPTYAQGSLGFPDGYKFAFQISSDEKANLNIVDSGRFYFAKNKATGQWYVDCDFY